MQLSEIFKIDSSYFTGGYYTLLDQKSLAKYKPSQIKKIHWKNQYNIYILTESFPSKTVQKARKSLEILMYDSSYKSDQGGQIVFHEGYGRLVGRLSLSSEDHQLPFDNAFSVDVVTVDNAYKNQGIAIALYTAALTHKKCVIVAGDEQTPGGVSMWVKLAKTPNIDVRGWMSFPSWVFEQDYSNKDKFIDRLMGRIGAQFLDEKTVLVSFPNKHEKYYFFEFGVTPAASNKQLKAIVKSELTDIYSQIGRNQRPLNVYAGMYAIAI